MIYQVVLVCCVEKRVWHVAYFKIHAHAVECMKKMHDLHFDKKVEIWGNTLYEANWDGNFNINEELTYGL